MDNPYKLVSQGAVEKDGLQHEAFDVMHGDEQVGSVQVAHANGQMKGFKTKGLRAKHSGGVIQALGAHFGVDVNKALPTFADTVQQMQAKVPGAAKMPKAAATSKPESEQPPVMSESKRRIVNAAAAQGVKMKPAKPATPAVAATPDMAKAVAWVPDKAHEDRHKDLMGKLQMVRDYMNNADLKDSAIPYMQVAMRDIDAHLGHAHNYMYHPTDSAEKFRQGVLGGKATEKHIRHMNAAESALKTWAMDAEYHARRTGAKVPALGIAPPPTLFQQLKDKVKSALGRKTQSAGTPAPMPSMPGGAPASQPTPQPTALATAPAATPSAQIPLPLGGNQPGTPTAPRKRSRKANP